jgi:hypothetical protein
LGLLFGGGEADCCDVNNYRGAERGRESPVVVRLI